MIGSPHTSMPYAMHHFKPWSLWPGFFYAYEKGIFKNAYSQKSIFRRLSGTRNQWIRHFSFLQFMQTYKPKEFAEQYKMITGKDYEEAEPPETPHVEEDTSGLVGWKG